MIPLVTLPEQCCSQIIPDKDRDIVLQYLSEEQSLVYSTKRGREEEALCASLVRQGNQIIATTRYFIGLDWIVPYKTALRVLPKYNQGDLEIDFLKMLHEALCEPENLEHLADLVTIKFEQPSIEVPQQQDFLSVFLITEYLHLLNVIVKKGLRQSFYTVEENLSNKVKGRIMVTRSILKNASKGRFSDNYCQYQVFGVDTPENRVLKKAFLFCRRQLENYQNAFDFSFLKSISRYVASAFEQVGDAVDVSTIQRCKGNPMFKDYFNALHLARLILRRYGYDLTQTGRHQVAVPPFWIDMSKLFELYVFSKLRKSLPLKGEVIYHLHSHRQELDFLLNPTNWNSPYIADTKYKLGYSHGNDVDIDDARQVCGYARLTDVYKRLQLVENTTLPIKCLIIYPDQNSPDHFTFDNLTEPNFKQSRSYIRLFMAGIRLPVISSKKETR